MGRIRAVNGYAILAATLYSPVALAGGKLVNFYFTTGDADFLLVTETNDAEFIAAILATAATGTISDVTTARAWTGAEFKAVADKASRMASLYRPPGKS